MSYASIHKSNERFEIVVVLVLLSMGITTIALMFIHPTAAIMLFWAGMLVAMVAGAVEFGIRRQERKEIRRSIAARACPDCGGELRTVIDNPPAWRCSACEAEFDQFGRTMIEVQSTA